MNAAAKVRLLRLPRITYGPHRALEAVPWLMLATVTRLLSLRDDILAVPLFAVAMACVFLSFLLVVRRVVEGLGGRTRLGDLDFRRQLGLTARALAAAFVLSLGAGLVLHAVGVADWTAVALFGLDGLAFHQPHLVAGVWSAVLGGVVLVLTTEADNEGRVRLRSVAATVVAAAPYLLAGAAAVLLGNVVLGALQGHVHAWVGALWAMPVAQALKNNVLYFFILGFAALRLWMTVTLLCVALRAFFRRRRASGASRH